MYSRGVTVWKFNLTVIVTKIITVFGIIAVFFKKCVEYVQQALIVLHKVLSSNVNI